MKRIKIGLLLAVLLGGQMIPVSAQEEAIANGRLDDTRAIVSLDPVLKREINKSLEVSNLNADVSTEQMKKLIGLDVDGESGKVINSLSGLEYAENLQRLNLGNYKSPNLLHPNQVILNTSDLSPLFGLPNFKELRISGENHALKDFNQIKKLASKLTTLEINTSGMTNFDGLSAMTKLNQLNLIYTTPSIHPNKREMQDFDFSVIDQLNNVTSLALTGYKLVNPPNFSEFTNLEGIALNGTNIEDISSLAPTAPINAIAIANNKKLEDVSHFVNFPKIKNYNLQANAIEDISWMKNIDFNLLEGVFVQENNISDISVFKGRNMPNFTYSSFSSNKIKDVSSLNGNYPKLERLLLTDNEITDFSQFSKYHATNVIIDGREQRYTASPITFGDETKLTLRDHLGKMLNPIDANTLNKNIMQGLRFGSFTTSATGFIWKEPTPPTNTTYNTMFLSNYDLNELEYPLDFGITYPTNQQVFISYRVTQEVIGDVAEIQAKDALITSDVAKALTKMEDLIPVNEAKVTTLFEGEKVPNVSASKWDDIKNGVLGTYEITYTYGTGTDKISKTVKLVVAENGIISPEKDFILSARDGLISSEEAKALTDINALIPYNQASVTLLHGGKDVPMITVVPADWLAIKTGVVNTYSVLYSYGSGTNMVQMIRKIRVYDEGILSPNKDFALMANNTILTQSEAKALTNIDSLNIYTKPNAAYADGTNQMPSVQTTDFAQIKAGTVGTFYVTYEHGTGANTTSKTVRVVIVKDGSILTPDRRASLYAEDATLTQEDGAEILSREHLIPKSKALVTLWDGSTLNPEIAFSNDHLSAVQSGTPGAYGAVFTYQSLSKNTTVWVTQEYETRMMFDYDKNGRIDISDFADFIRFYTYGGANASPVEFMLSDYNSDGRINIDDLSEIRYYMTNPDKKPPTIKVPI